MGLFYLDGEMISFLSPDIHYWPQIVVSNHIILHYKDQKNHAHLFICALGFLEDSFHLQYLRLKFILCSLGTLNHGFLGESHTICTSTFIICVLSDVGERKNWMQASYTPAKLLKCVRAKGPRYYHLTSAAVDLPSPFLVLAGF